MNELIIKTMKDMIGKNIKVYFKYDSLSYNIRKAGKLKDCDESNFVLDEIKDGTSVYSYSNVANVVEAKD